MFKVAVLQTSQGDSQSQYLDKINCLKGMAARSNMPGSVEIKVFVTGGIEQDNVARQLEGIRRYEPDALVSVGGTCSLAAKAFFHKEAANLPIIFIGVADPAKIGLAGDTKKPTRNITGVSVEAPPDALPIQALIKLRRNIKRFIFVCRKNVFEGRVGIEIGHMEEYVQQTQRSTLCIQFDEGDDLTEVLGKHIKEYDGVVIPRLGLIARDLEKIDKICNAKEAFLFAQADGFIPESAICGYSGDIQFMGHRVACLLYEILYNKKPVSELPIEIHPSPSRLVVSKTAVIRHGIVMGPEDFHIIFDGDTHKMTLRHTYSFVAPHMSILELRLYKELIEAGMRTDDGSEYRPILQEGRCYDEEFTAEQAVYILEDENPFIVTIGTRMAARLQNAMVKRGIFKPMVLIAYDDDEDASLLSDTSPQWPTHAFTRTVTIPMVKPAIFPSITKLLQPHTKSVGCVYSFCADNLPAHVADRLGAAQEYCEQSGLTFFHGGDSRSNQTFDLVCQDIMKKTNSLFTMPDCIRGSDLGFTARNCHASNTFVLGGDDDNFHVVSGILALDYSKLVPAILELIVDISWERVPRQTQTKLKPEQIYYFYLNEPWLRTHGVELPDNLTELFGINVLRDPYNDDRFDPPGKDQDEINKRLEQPLFITEEEFKKRFKKEVAPTHR